LKQHYEFAYLGGFGDRLREDFIFCNSWKVFDYEPILLGFFFKAFPFCFWNANFRIIFIDE